MAPAGSDDDDYERRHRSKKRHRKKGDDSNTSEEEEEDRKSRRRRRSRRDRSESGDDDDDDDESDDDRRKRRKKERKRRKEKKRKKSRHSSKKKKSRRSRSSSEEDSDDSSNSSSEEDAKQSSATAPSAKLLAKLQARGETLEERQARRAERATQKRAAQIASITGYTAEDNPFHDPNLHQPFTWRKKQQTQESAAIAAHKKDEKTLHEIEKLRQRRIERELQMEEMDRIKREEARMKELENFDDWARKEEAFHLQQQRQRSAIRLVRGREKPIDVLAKNLLLFGLTEEEKSLRGAAVKYQETNNALVELENFQAELEEPFAILQKLKLEELQEVLNEIDAFLSLERQVMDQASSSFESSTVSRYWEALRIVTLDEIKIIQTGGAAGTHATQAKEIHKIFAGQSTADLKQMQTEIQAKLTGDGSIDKEYWRAVQDQLAVHLAKVDLSAMHQKMLVRQLEKLEQKRDELAQKRKDGTLEAEEDAEPAGAEAGAVAIPSNATGDEGDLEEELGLSNEVGTKAPDAYAWADKYRPRKPRYFNRVKTGYDWNKYNKTHYDKDNPPPKTVQGYKFNIFYPDLIDPSKTPQFVLEAADSPDFCIIRFKAGPPYEDVAFKIVNREWNKARKRGFRCTFERGILSLYFNFKTSWYRR
uniref:Splicing factor Cactin n=1 Tax=Amphora coffeiformis TaxID=265554 RepID=A0A7S3L1D2_9STRA